MSSPVADRPPALRTSLSRRQLLLGGALLWLVYGYFVHFWPHFHAANESIRLYFAQAVVDEGKPTIDGVLRRYHRTNVDAARTPAGLTLDKAPGLSYAAMPLYWVFSRLGLSTKVRDVHRIYYLLSLLIVSLLSVLGVYWLGRVVTELTGREEAGLVAAAVFALATPFALYATLFFGHAPATALLCGSLYMLLRGRPLRAGLLAGAMVFVETPTLLLGIGLGVFVLLRERRLTVALRFIAGALPFAVLQGLHNAWLVGSPWIFPYRYKATGAFAKVHATGLYGFAWPRWESLWGLTFGSQRGLFFHAPLLLLGALGLLLLARRRGRAALALSLLALAHLLWIAAFVDWRAGDSFSARHLLPLIPFWAIGLGALFAERDTLAPRVRSILLTTGVAFFTYSLVATWAPVATFPYAPLGFTVPLAELSLPLLGRGVLAPSLASWAGLPAIAVLVLFAGLVAALLLWLLWQLRPGGVVRRPVVSLLARTLSGLAGGALLALLLLGAGRPDLTRASLRDSVLVHCLLEDAAYAATRCREAGGRFLPARCACRLPSPRRGGL